jgi:hypothetical protein
LWSGDLNNEDDLQPSRNILRLISLDWANLRVAIAVIDQIWCGRTFSRIKFGFAHLGQELLQKRAERSKNLHSQYSIRLASAGNRSRDLLVPAHSHQRSCQVGMTLLAWPSKVMTVMPSWHELSPATTEKLVYVYLNSKMEATVRDADKLKIFAWDNEDV